MILVIQQYQRAELAIQLIATFRIKSATKAYVNQSKQARLFFSQLVFLSLFVFSRYSDIFTFLQQSFFSTSYISVVLFCLVAEEHNFE